MFRPKPLFTLIALLTVAPPLSGVAWAETDPNSAEAVTECMARNIPQKTSLQTVEFRAKDRVGGERITRAKIYGKRFDDGLRRILMRFFKPNDINGAAFLMIEKDERNDMFLYSPELRRTRRVTSHNASGSLFGTDFSYEDFERLQGLDKRGRVERLADGSVAERPVHVVEIYPAELEVSSYEVVRFHVDQQTCVTIKTESFEKGHKLRKVLTATPESLAESGGIWIAREILMKDLKDETETRLIIEEVEIDLDISDKRFRLAELERRKK